MPLPIQLAVGAVARAPSAIVFGIDPNGFVARRLVFTAGHGPTPGQAVVGDLLAKRLHVARGGTIRLGGRTFRIAGVFHSGITFRGPGRDHDAHDAQALAGRTSQETTTIAIRLAPRVTPGDREGPTGQGVPGPVSHL